jgi:hypothetical protein
MIIWTWLKRVVEDEFCKYEAKILDYFSKSKDQLQGQQF